MTNRDVKIFAISSFISSVYCSIHHKIHHHPGEYLIVIIDSLPFKKSYRKNLAAIIDTFNPDLVIDLSTEVMESHERLPSLTKRLTRRVKEKPLFKQLYNWLFRIKTKNDVRLLKRYLEKELSFQKFVAGQKVEIISQPMHYALQPLQQIFPKASFAYCEHGLGDYMDIMRLNKFEYPFINVFHEKWQHYISNSKLSQPIFSNVEFQNQQHVFQRQFPHEKKQIEQYVGADRIVLVCLQALETYGLKEAFWSRFLDDAIGQIKSTDKMLFLIKPHPYQSDLILTFVENYFDAKKINYRMIDHINLKSFSIEILFSFISKSVEALISPFSSCIFYLSKFYENTNINFYYSVKYCFDSGSVAPFYIHRWEELNDYIEKVFSSKNLIEVRPNQNQEDSFPTNIS